MRPTGCAREAGWYAADVEKRPDGPGFPDHSPAAGKCGLDGDVAVTNPEIVEMVEHLVNSSVGQSEKSRRYARKLIRELLDLRRANELH